jgi:threonine/homoserine/homoserine lactone efflux protein
VSGLAPSTILAFAATCTVVELTPGPNMGYLATLSVSRGARVGIAAVAGVAIGLAIYGLVAALGLAAIIEQSRLLYEALRWAGVAYLLWLAWESWAVESEIAPERPAYPADAVIVAFRRGLITNLLNPKAGIFYVAVLPSFVTSETGVTEQTLLLSAIFVAIATSIHLAVVLLASRLHGFLTAPERRSTMRRAFAVVLAAIAVWFAVSTAR